MLLAYPSQNGCVVLVLLDILIMNDDRKPNTFQYQPKAQIEIQFGLLLS